MSEGEPASDRDPPEPPVRKEEAPDPPPEARASADTPPASRYHLPVLTIPALLVMVGGIGVALRHSGGDVTSITMTRAGGLSGLMPELGAPDYFLKVHTRERAYLTEAYQDIPIGNGLSWELAEAIPLEDIRQIEVYDQDIISDDRMDRVTITDWVADGQQFHFELVGSRSPLRLVGIVIAFLGGAFLLYTTGKFVRDQVV